MSVSAEKQRLKLERTCPRCRAHRYHFGRRWLFATTRGTKMRVDIDCAECGHTWKGRYKADEWV